MYNEYDDDDNSNDGMAFDPIYNAVYQGHNELAIRLIEYYYH